MRRLSTFLLHTFESLLLGLHARFEPRRVGDLYLLRGFLIHLHTKTWLVGDGDVSLLNDFAFLDEALPGVQVIDPVPLTDKEVGDSGADVCRSHLADGRNNTVGSEGDLVGV